MSSRGERRGGLGLVGQDACESSSDSDTNSLGCLNNVVGLTPIDANTWCAKGDWDRMQWVPAGAAVCAALPLNDDLPWILGVMLVVSAGAPRFAASRGTGSVSR